MSSEYEYSCQYCGVVIGDDEGYIETGHGRYHEECVKEILDEDI